MLDRIAIAVLVPLWAGCGPRPKASPRPVKAAPAPRASARQAPPSLLLGWMCPTAAAGRPAVIPWAVRARDWQVDADVGRLIATKAARQFSVLSWRGKRAGVFAVAGAARSQGAQLGVGAYAGAGPCDGDDGEVIADCARATGGCGIAVARLQASGGVGAPPFEEDPDPHEIKTSAVCDRGAIIAIDVDGDGRFESFPREAFWEAGELPSEIVAQAGRQPVCDGSFAVASILPALSLIGAADIDGDGRVELLLLNERLGEVALYRSVQTPLRLERAFVVRLPAVR